MPLRPAHSAPISVVTIGAKANLSNPMLGLFKTRTCAKCHRSLPYEARRCPACNTSVHRRTPRALVSVMLVLLFTAFCVLLYWLTRRSFSVKGAGLVGSGMSLALA